MPDFTALPLAGQVLIALLLGAIVGSFLNVVIHRLPILLKQGWRRDCRDFLQLETADEAEEKVHFSLIWPGSHCPACKTPIRPQHNIPLLGYLWLRGRCADCQTKISVRYPVVELITALASGLVVWHFGLGYQGSAALLLTWSLIALTGIDFDEHLLPDCITLPLLWLGLILNSFGLFTDLQSAVWGAIAGYGSLWLVYWGFKLVTGKQGMGFGDFKLLAALGAWFGWSLLPAIVLMSSMVGILFAIIFMLTSGNKRSTAIAFGPYLAIAGWVCMFVGADWLAWILP